MWGHAIQRQEPVSPRLPLKRNVTFTTLIVGPFEANLESRIAHEAESVCGKTEELMEQFLIEAIEGDTFGA
jgi:hypothetical protein